MGYNDTKVKNFAIHRKPDSCVRAYSKDVHGCDSTGADVMITVGSTIEVLDGNNKTTDTEAYKHVDIFMTQKQAENFHRELGEILKRNREAMKPVPHENSVEA